MSKGIVLSRAEICEMAKTAGPASVLHEFARKASRAPRRDLEHEHQTRLFQWAAEHETEIPELAMLFAIPNFMGLGKAGVVQSARLKAEGRKKGMLDWCLPIARGGYHSLYGEMKTATGKASTEQRWWIEHLRAAGHRVEIVRGFEPARDLILSYLHSDQ